MYFWCEQQRVEEALLVLRISPCAALCVLQQKFVAWLHSAWAHEDDLNTPVVLYVVCAHTHASG